MSAPGWSSTAARPQRLTVDGGRATGAELADGTRLSAGQVVLAAGSHSGRLAGVPDEVLPPVRPVKGQVLRLRMPDVPAGSPPSCSRTVRAVVRGGPLYLVPRENGELVVGATSEELGWDTTVTAGGVYELLRDAHELVPGITELPLVETCAGLRPASPDNAPLLGPTALPGLHLATGHYRNGVLLTPVTGDAMAEVLATGELPEEARPFSPARFTPATPGPERTRAPRSSPHERRHPHAPTVTGRPSTARPARSPADSPSTGSSRRSPRRPPGWPRRSTKPSCRAPSGPPPRSATATASRCSPRSREADRDMTAPRPSGTTRRTDSASPGSDPSPSPAPPSRPG